MMNPSANLKSACLFLGVACLANNAVLAQTELFVAGSEPAERPRQAPIITDIDKDAAWYERALHGIEKPYPYSLRFLEDQGNWYTPFNRPGMTGRYDIRGWHHQAANP